MYERKRSHTHHLTERTYENIRRESRLRVQRELPQQWTSANGTVVLREEVTLGTIDNLAKIEASKWQQDASRKVNWDWTASVGQYAWRNPQRFELAVWYKKVYLAGLSLGRPTATRAGLRLDFIERNPTNNPMEGLIAEITITAAESYARAIGASEIRIMNPINQAVRDFYLSNGWGYTFINRHDYCQKRLI